MQGHPQPSLQPTSRSQHRAGGSSQCPAVLCWQDRPWCHPSVSRRWLLSQMLNDMQSIHHIPLFQALTLPCLSPSLQSLPAADGKHLSHLWGWGWSKGSRSGLLLINSVALSRSSAGGGEPFSSRVLELMLLRNYIHCSLKTSTSVHIAAIERL